MDLVQTSNVLTQDRPQSLLHTMKIVLRPTPSLQYARHDAHSVSATHSGHTALARTISTCCKQRISIVRSVSTTHDGPPSLQHTMDIVQTHTISTVHNGLSVDHAVCSTQWTQCRPTTSIQHRMDTIQTTLSAAHKGDNADPQHLCSIQWT